MKHAVAHMFSKINEKCCEYRIDIPEGIAV